MGKRTPLDNKPLELSMFAEWYYEKYILLCNSKNFNNRITASEIKPFYEMLNDPIDPIEEFMYIITSIDSLVSSRGE